MATAIVVVSCNDLAVHRLDANNEASSDRPRKSPLEDGSEFSTDSQASFLRKDASSDRAWAPGRRQGSAQQRPLQARNRVRTCGRFGTWPFDIGMWLFQNDCLNEFLKRLLSACSIPAGGPNADRAVEPHRLW